MKKVFSLTASNKRPDRQVEWVKHEVNKYVARERRKTLPDGVDFWDFDCKFGLDSSSAKVIHLTEIGKKIDQAFAAEAPSVYIEILVKTGTRTKKAVKTDIE